MPRTPEASAAVRDATRARIRRAAVLLMAEQGYHATTLRQVAARAGVADGLPSRYFGSKSGLLIDVADGWRERTRSALAAQQGSDPKVTLRLLVRSALLGLDTSPRKSTKDARSPRCSPIRRLGTSCARPERTSPPPICCRPWTMPW
ncbi:TetR/AcrR family transcriptional regulator [Streptomyces rhizosphaericus]|uniref:TetR/AcrR family transcriptional regulator n=1 Tax=Streptomyces rhizosphaericus TaxID=114699 RepID=UPI0036385468